MTEIQLASLRYLKANGTSALSDIKKATGYSGQPLELWGELMPLSPKYIERVNGTIAIKQAGEILLQSEEQKIAEINYVEQLEFRKLQNEVESLENNLKDYPLTKKLAIWAIVLSALATLGLFVQIYLQLTDK